METFDLKRYKDILLKTFAKFIEICEKHNLKYYCAGGTAIGAIRHHGFIPWDDDIDLYMPRKDYEKFLSVGNQYDGYRVQSVSNCDKLFIFGKFYDTNTTLWEFKQIPLAYGIYIDIFPLDETTDNLDGFMKKYNKLRMLQRKYQLSQMKPSMKDIFASARKMDKNMLIKNILAYFIPSMLSERYRQRIIECEKAWSSSAVGLYYASYMGNWWQKELVKREWFDEYIEVPFEHLKVRVCKQYDAYLKQMYGNYMTLPPIEKQVSHHYHYYLNMDKGLTLEEVQIELSSKNR